MSNTPPVRSLGAISTSRIEAFSDGVFAIATTLLVLEIAVPRVEEGEDLFVALLNLWPSYLAYLVSFLTIGIMWINHHFLIGLFQRVNRPLLFLNLGLLAVVSFIPFPTAVLAEYLPEGSGPQLSAATTLYGVVMLLLTVMFALLWRHAGRATDELRDADATRPIIRRALRFTIAAASAYVTAIVVAAFVPIVALALFAVVVLLFAFGRLAK